MVTEMTLCLSSVPKHLGAFHGVASSGGREGGREAGRDGGEGRGERRTFPAMAQTMWSVAICTLRYWPGGIHRQADAQRRESKEINFLASQFPKYSSSLCAP